MLLQATHRWLANSHPSFHRNPATARNTLRLFEKLHLVTPPRMHTATVGREREKAKCHLVVRVKNSQCGAVSDVNHHRLHFRQLNYTLCQREVSKPQGVFWVWDYVFALENYRFSERGNFWKLICTGSFWSKSLPNPARGEQIKLGPDQKRIQISRTLPGAPALLCQQEHRQRTSRIFLRTGLWTNLTHLLQASSQASANIFTELTRKWKENVFFFPHFIRLSDFLSLTIPLVYGVTCQVCFSAE